MCRQEEKRIKTVGYKLSGSNIGEKPVIPVSPSAQARCVFTYNNVAPRLASNIMLCTPRGLLLRGTPQKA